MVEVGFQSTEKTNGSSRRGRNRPYRTDGAQSSAGGRRGSRGVSFTVLQKMSAYSLSIIFVHGLGGHPRGTWTYTGPEKDPEPSQLENAPLTDQQIQHHVNETLVANTLEEQEENVNQEQGTNSNETQAANLNEEQAENARPVKKFLSHLRRPFKSSSSRLGNKGKAKGPAELPATDIKTNPATKNKSKSNMKNVFFWPQNLPEACARARVMTFGYDSDVTKFFGGTANQNTFYQHAGDLLGALTRKRKHAVCAITTCNLSPSLLVELAGKANHLRGSFSRRYDLSAYVLVGLPQDSVANFRICI